MTPAFRNVVEQLPPGTIVPVVREQLLTLLDLAGVVVAAGAPTPVARTVDFSIAELALQFGKAPSTLREWCEQGRFPGAYRRRGREWRIPEAAVVEMQREARQAHEAVTASDIPRLRPPSTPRAGGALELDSWRRTRPA